MDGVSLNTVNVAVEASMARTADVKDTQTLQVLKKALDSDKDMVAKLLPTPSGGRLDIQA